MTRRETHAINASVLHPPDDQASGRPPPGARPSRPCNPQLGHQQPPPAAARILPPQPGAARAASPSARLGNRFRRRGGGALPSGVLQPSASRVTCGGRRSINLRLLTGPGGRIRLVGCDIRTSRGWGEGGEVRLPATRRPRLVRPPRFRQSRIVERRQYRGAAAPLPDRQVLRSLVDKYSFFVSSLEHVVAIRYQSTPYNKE